MSRPTVTIISADGSASKDTAPIPNVFKVSEWKPNTAASSLDPATRRTFADHEIFVTARYSGDGKLRFSLFNGLGSDAMIA